MFRPVIIWGLLLSGLISVVMAQECIANCSFCAYVELYTWMEVSASHTVTVATILEVVNTDDETTRTTTIFDESAGQYTLPVTDQAGTQVTTFSYVQQGTTYTSAVTFPTPFNLWPDTYAWAGTLYSDDGDGSRCLTVPRTNATFPSQPQPTTIVTPTPSEGIYDPYGLLFTMAAAIIVGQDLTSWFSEGAFQSCTLSCSFDFGPQPALSTAFMIQSLRTYEGRSESPSATTMSSDEGPSHNSDVSITTSGSGSSAETVSPSSSNSGAESTSMSTGGSSSTDGSSSTGGSSSTANTAACRSSRPALMIWLFICALTTLIA